MSARSTALIGAFAALLACSPTAPPHTPAPSSASQPAETPQIQALALSALPLSPRDHQIVRVPTSKSSATTLSAAFQSDTALQACAARHPNAFIGQGGAVVLLMTADGQGLRANPEVRHYLLSPAPKWAQVGVFSALEECVREPIRNLLKAGTFASSGVAVGYIWGPLVDPSQGREPALPLR